MTRSIRALAGLALLLAGSMSVAAGPAVQDPETFRATAQHVGTGPSGQAGAVIQISRWSTDDERNHLARVLVEQGSNALADALNEQEDVGFIRFPTFRAGPPSTRLRYAREFRQGNQRMIILGTDRTIGWAETLVRPQRTIDNRVTLIQLMLDANDEGEGVLALGVEMQVDAATNTLRISNVSSQPIRLTNVRK